MCCRSRKRPIPPQPSTIGRAFNYCDRFFARPWGRLEAEDRPLIKMLLIDDVPQKELAESLGIHSGNLTRCKQRITAAVWQVDCPSGRAMESTRSRGAA